MYKEHLNIDHIPMEFPTPKGAYVALEDVDLVNFIPECRAGREAGIWQKHLSASTCRAMKNQ
jgi:hypothetical protein